jgi:hypothetical protein
MSPKVKLTLIVLAAVIVGAAYGDRIPVVSTVAKKLPGSTA